MAIEGHLFEKPFRSPDSLEPANPTTVLPSAFSSKARRTPSLSFMPAGSVTPLSVPPAAANDCSGQIVEGACSVGGGKPFRLRFPGRPKPMSIERAPVGIRPADCRHRQKDRIFQIGKAIYRPTGWVKSPKSYHPRQLDSCKSRTGFQRRPGREIDIGCATPTDSYSPTWDAEQHDIQFNG